MTDKRNIILLYQDSDFSQLNEPIVIRSFEQLEEVCENGIEEEESDDKWQ